MVTIATVPVYDKSISSAIEEIVTWCDKDKPKINNLVSATGAHGIVCARRDKIFLRILHKFRMNLPDGMPSVWIGRLKGARQMGRCYGPDVLRDLMVASAETEIKHFLCGGKSGIAEELREVCNSKFNNSNIVGVFSPPFREMTDNELRDLADEINKSNANIVWIGLSTPKQEIFAYRLSRFARVNCIITVGAAFDYHTGRLLQSPKFIQAIGMEWFFRLAVEPRRLYRRYFEIVPLFIYYNIQELFRYLIHQKMQGEETDVEG